MNARVKQVGIAEFADVSFEQLDLAALDSTDITRIAQLETQLFGRGAWSADAVSQELEAPARSYWVARFNDDHTIIAYAGFWFDGQDAQIMTIGVDEQYQGRHIASHLMHMMKEESARLGADRMLLEVATDNEIALSVYRSAGFEQLGLRKRYYQPENKDAYTMSYTIAPERVYPVGFSVPADARSGGDSDLQGAHETGNHSATNQSFVGQNAGNQSTINRSAAHNENVENIKNVENELGK